MSEHKKLVHTERIPVRWGDMDAMGHVNNTVYFRYMEQTRICWFEKLLPRAEAWSEHRHRHRQRLVQLQEGDQLSRHRRGEGLRRHAGKLERGDFLRDSP